MNQGKELDSHQQLEKLLYHSKDGSYATQSARSDILHQFIDNIHQSGYIDFNLARVGKRHIEKSVENWQAKGLSPATMANRASHLRWLAQKLNKQNIVLKTNKELGIERRSHIAETNKAQQLPSREVLEKFTQRQQLSMQLSREFGLRREESLKFQVNVADKGDRIELKGSWCKNGRARTLEVRTSEQRDLLNKIKSVVGKQNQSLIPKDQSYFQAMKDLSNKCSDNNIRMHGLRHAYAQDRYKELTGRVAPVIDKTTAKRDVLDKVARLQIARELGHGRKDVTNSYLGSSSS